MKSNKKNEEPYKTIGQVAKELDLVNKDNGKLQTHTIRYWETQFKQIKPIILAGKRRYYSPEIIKIIKYTKFLLKDKGLTIIGAKNLLNNKKTHHLDEDVNSSINSENLNKNKIIKNKILNISRIIKKLKAIK
jgi:DNA-binding transcriptional MerR regulator